MTTRLNPYLSFRGNAREAMTKYHGVFGGDLDLAPFSMFDMPVDDAEKEWVMHGFLKTAAGHTLMGADVPSSMDLPPNGVVALTGDEPDVVRGWWDALAENGTIELPLKQAPWGDYFGELTDEFGIRWMVDFGKPSTNNT